MKGLALPITIFVAVLFIIIGCVLSKEIFWDQFIWKYYWGPIVADAGGDAKGLTSSYNWVDTLSYGLILAISAYYIHKLFVKKEMRMGLGFFLAMSPVLLIGPSVRVLEDMELFNEPLQYIFISPMIYIFLGSSTLTTILLFRRLEVNNAKGGKWFDRGTFLMLLLPGLMAVFMIKAFPGQLNEDIPIWPIIVGTPLIAYLYTRFRTSTRWEGGVGIFWTEVLLMVIYLYGLWLREGRWYDDHTAINGVEPAKELPGGLLIIFLVILSTVIISLIIWLLSKKYEKWRSVLTGVNIMIIGGHMLDASATFIGIDRYGYIEKHILPSTLIGWTGTAAVMYPLKLVFLIPALFIMDVGMADESKENPHLMALVKLTILVLGFAPGFRDLVRLAIGV